LKSEKNVKYVFSNTGFTLVIYMQSFDTVGLMIWRTYRVW